MSLLCAPQQRHAQRRAGISEVLVQCGKRQAVLRPFLPEVFANLTIPDDLWVEVTAIQPAAGDRPFVS